MKILSYAGFGIGLIAGAMALYLHFVVVPEAHSAKNTISRITSSTMYDRESQPAEMEALREQSGQNIDYGEYTLLLGGLAFLVSIFPAVKRNKFAIIGASMGLISFFIGAAYGTHMFS